ncbi:hypothetical protein [Demequina globuliformis]|uniref:hypothetical protein n=1 Tax=Demequina globuliformis TaxID=676202 RepID=UPI0007859239|nr:hypothetical protein [Demequina globuliformis]
MTTFTPTERRQLDRDRSAYVVHHGGGFAVTDGYTTVPAHDLDDAKRREFVHNYLAGFQVSREQLRDPMRAVAS